MEAHRGVFWDLFGGDFCGLGFEGMRWIKDGGRWCCTGGFQGNFSTFKTARNKLRQASRGGSFGKGGQVAARGNRLTKDWGKTFESLL
jgi:hypothetical protein